MQDLIRKLSRDNPLCGAQRVGETLLLLGYEPPCEDTVRKHMLMPQNPGPKSTTELISIPLLAGLHHRYVRVAA